MKTSEGAELAAVCICFLIALCITHRPRTFANV
jgi:hypothetical protein